MNPSIATNRRNDQEMRWLDLGPPPGQAERRGLPERRHPQVEHLDFDEHIELRSPGDAPYDS